jgi:multisubunit Na+/H+ antiporter MnhG subunit
MSSLPADIIIWVLLFAGTIFSGIGLMGLLIFPDTRSRMFTAFRATAIGFSAVVLAVILYGYTLFNATGEKEYMALIFRTLFLAVVMAAGTWMMYGIIRERTKKDQPVSAGHIPAGPEDKGENNA